jgi:hypothetical protein
MGEPPHASISMNTGYAHAKTVYKEMRERIAPWSKPNGFRRWLGTQAGWRKAINAGQLLGFKFEGSAWGKPDTGNSLTGLLQLDPYPGELTATPIRQTPFSCCLDRSELDQLARIQGAINQRRPPLPFYLKKDFKADTLLGHGLREMYDPAPEYREGQLVEFSYYTIEDVRNLTAFIVAVLPAALERFAEGRVATPIDTTPAHLSLGVEEIRE